MRNQNGQTVYSDCNVLKTDTDGDGYPDCIDPEKNIYTYVPFTSKTYMLDVKNTALNQYKTLANERPIYSHISGKQRAKVWAQLQIKIMMKDVNECPYTYLVSDETWFDFCIYFNKQVKIYDRIKEYLHYFRLKLNRCPETLDDMIKTINNTENDDNGKNMGTYNYASSSKDSSAHNKYDVDTYEDWGNTPLDSKPIKGSWNDNVIENGLLHKSEPRIKGEDSIDIEARDYYYYICEQIGVFYYTLLEKDYSDSCY